MTMIFLMYTQNRTASTVLWLLRNINPFSRGWYAVGGTPMPFLFLCSKLVKYTGLEQGILIPILIPKTLVISHPRFKPGEAGLPYSPIPIFEQLSKSHPSLSQSWSCQKINQILLKSSESRNYGINSSTIATKIQHINESII